MGEGRERSFRTTGSPLRSVDDLTALLSSRHIPLERWGEGGAKTVQNLLDELTSGEAILIQANGEIHREVYTAAVAVFFKQENGVIERLEELRRVFADGSFRVREYPTSVSEKKLPHETYEDAARRGLAEELGIRGTLKLIPGAFSKEPTNGASFPGLMSYAEIQNFSVWLPRRFYRSRYTEVGKDKTIHFGWVPQAERESA